MVEQSNNPIMVFEHQMLLQALSGIPMCLSKHAVKIKFLDRPREVSDRVIKKIYLNVESLWFILFKYLLFQ